MLGEGRDRPWVLRGLFDRRDARGGAQCHGSDEQLHVLWRVIELIGLPLLKPLLRCNPPAGAASLKPRGRVARPNHRLPNRGRAMKKHRSPKRH
jgi:hypothetical protein